MWILARRGWPARALAAALALVVYGGALDWGHMGGDDADCGVALSVGLVQHDHNAHRMSGAPHGQESQTGHCYICHSLRQLHAALKAREGRIVLDASCARFRHAGVLQARSAPGLSLSSRAPPFAVL